MGRTGVPYGKAAGSEWVKVEATAGDGTITATLEGDSLVALYNRKQEIKNEETKENNYKYIFVHFLHYFSY